MSFSTCFGLDQALHIYTHIGLLVAVITVVCHTEGPCWITRLKTPRADCVESGNPLIARCLLVHLFSNGQIQLGRQIRKDK